MFCFILFILTVAKSNIIDTLGEGKFLEFNFILVSNSLCQPPLLTFVKTKFIGACEEDNYF